MLDVVRPRVGVLGVPRGFDILGHFHVKYPFPGGTFCLI